MTDQTGIARQQQAAQWFSTLRRGVMTREECLEYDCWRQDPDNAAAMSALRGLWDGLEPLRHYVQADRREEADSARSSGNRPHAAPAAVIFAAAWLVVGVIKIFDSPALNMLDWWSR